MKTGWGWVLAYGIIVMLIGLIALFNPLATGLATGILLSMALLIYGVLALVTGFSSLSRRARWLEVLLGVLSIVAAGLMFFNPFAGAFSLVILIGAWLFAIGIFEIVGAFRSRYDRLWRFVLGIIDTILGGILLFANPVSALTFLAAVIGISFLIRGIFLVTLALGLRRIERS
ncbi:HdeD family acid-resistance protein [Altericroceibacterium spongiae]|uniref:HdeD family acid-resistance protein n=2 Tax=Altericroceibacterium spongiae TaxID=2320269 RepID=A0A420EAJ6_9SPHN|nr:HdeD family acid-resistance protein [Altericroceibacterium spongiae]